MDCGIDTRIGMESGIAVLAPYQYHSGIAGIFAKPGVDLVRSERRGTALIEVS